MEFFTYKKINFKENTNIKQNITLNDKKGNKSKIFFPFLSKGCF